MRADANSRKPALPAVFGPRPSIARLPVPCEERASTPLGRSEYYNSVWTDQDQLTARGEEWDCTTLAHPGGGRQSRDGSLGLVWDGLKYRVLRRRSHEAHGGCSDLTWVLLN